MLRRLPMLLLAAWAVPSCEQPIEDDIAPPPPAPQRYVYQDPRTTAWRVFDEGGDFRPLVQPVPGGLVEWTSGSVVGEGRGLARGNTPQDGLMARRAARLLAARNALLAAGGIAVGPGGNFLNVANGTIRMEATIRDFQEIRNDYDPATRTATAAVRIPMYGAHGIIQIAGLGLRETPRPWRWPDAPTGEPAAGTQGEARMVVLDLRAAAFSPALLPRVLSPDGECVFDAAELGVAELSWRPAATYVVYQRPRALGAGPAPALVKVEPYVVRDGLAPDGDFANSVGRTFRGAAIFPLCQAGRGSGTIFLSKAAVEYLRAHPWMRQLFRSGKIVIVVETAPASRVP